jgi:hypothetical protein
VHDLVALKTGSAAFVLSQEEARIIAVPTAALLDHYGLAVPAAYGVWGNLFLALGTVYGPKFSAAMGYGEAPTPPSCPPARAPYRASADGYALMGALQ